jgi:peptidyl-tRNA hydrolase
MLKQYVWVPLKPKMTAGKIASQVAHATFLALEKEHRKIIKKWRDNGMCVIVLECKDITHLNHIQEYLTTWNITHHKYIDESEALTPTALATGIITEDKSWIFENFNLYGGRK